MKSSQMIHMDTILSSYQGRNTDYQARCLKSGLFDRKRKTDGHTIEWYNSTSGRTLTLRLQIYGIPLRDFNVLPLPRLETGDQFMTWAGTPSDFVEPSNFEGVVYTVNNVSVERTYANERATIEQAIELSEGVSTRDGLAQPNFVDTFYSDRVQRDVALNWVETDFTLDSWDSDPHFEITEE